MKFYERHRKDLLKSIQEHGLSKDDFSFIKRRGRIITQRNQSKKTFSYIQKSETTIDEKTKDWIDITYFELKINDSSPQKIKDWKAVMSHFENWLQYNSP